jgi:hypothetical protein
VGGGAGFGSLGQITGRERGAHPRGDRTQTGFQNARQARLGVLPPWLNQL